MWDEVVCVSVPGGWACCPLVIAHVCGHPYCLASVSIRIRSGDQAEEMSPSRCLALGLLVVHLSFHCALDQFAPEHGLSSPFLSGGEYPAVWADL